MSGEVNSLLDIDINALFKKYKAEVVWETKQVRIKGNTEEIYELPEDRRHWTLTGKYGVISLGGIKEIGDVRLAAALFLYLWGEKKVPVAIAMRCAISHIKLYNVRRADNDDRQQILRGLSDE